MWNCVLQYSLRHFHRGRFKCLNSESGTAFGNSKLIAGDGITNRVTTGIILTAPDICVMFSFSFLF